MRFSTKGSINISWNKSSEKKSILDKIKDKIESCCNNGDVNSNKEGINGVINYDIGVDMSVEEFNAIRAANRADMDAMLKDTQNAIDSGKLIMDWIRSEINPTFQAIADGSKLYQKLDHEINMSNIDLDLELTLKRKAARKAEEDADKDEK